MKGWRNGWELTNALNNIDENDKRATPWSTDVHSNNARVIFSKLAPVIRA